MKADMWKLVMAVVAGILIERFLKITARLGV